MPEMEELKIRILERLSDSHTNCRAFKWLTKNVEKNRSKLKKALRELYREFKVRKKNINKIENYCLPKFNGNVVKVGILIYDSVSRSEEPLTSAEIAKKGNLDSRYVTRICNRFKKEGYITKGKRKETKKRLYFAPVTGEVINASNYEKVSTIYRELRNVVSKFNLEDPELKQHLRKSLESIQTRRDLAKSQKSIENFKNDLLTEVNKAEKKEDIHDFLGVKPFHPKVTTWKMPK